MTRVLLDLRKPKDFISKTAQFFTKSGAKTKKKVLTSKSGRILMRNHKKRIFIAKPAKKQLLLTNSGVTTSILEVTGLELLSSDTEPVTFFGAHS